MVDVPSRYSGGFSVIDEANNKIYLADKIYEWQVGHDLSDWWTGGNTAPTIGSDGQIDFFENTNADNQATIARYDLPDYTEGFFKSVIHFKITRQSDDTKDDYASWGIGHTRPFQTGNEFFYDSVSPNTRYLWRALSYNAVSTIYPGAITPNEEITFDGIVGPSYVIFLKNNVEMARYPVNRTSAGAIPTPLQDWMKDKKFMYFWFRHDAGTVTHWKVRDVKIGRLVGVSSL